MTDGPIDEREMGLLNKLVARDAQIEQLEQELQDAHRMVVARDQIIRELRARWAAVFAGALSPEAFELLTGGQGHSVKVDAA